MKETNQKCVSLVYKICEIKCRKLKNSKKFTLHVQLARANRN